MGPILKFLISLERLVRAGGIKRIEQALDFAKREFGEVSPLFQKQIQRVFDKVNKPKVGKDVKKEGEVVPFKKEGIETLETLTDAKTLKDEGSVTLDRIQEATEKLKEDPKLQQILRDMGVEDTPDLDSTDNLRSAIKNMEDRMRVGNNESNIRATLREFLERRLKDGTLDIPDAAERDAIEKVYQGGVDPIEVFRKAYGEDALIAVDDVFDQYGDNIMRESNNYKEIGDKFEKLFKFNRGFYDMGELPVPKKQYGYDEGLMTNQEFTEKLKKDLREKEILEDFDPTDRTKNAQGGLNTITLDKEFTKVFEDASSKKLAARDEKQATREKRYRELIASNKFPELNNFFREKITTRVQANIGGAFTTGQRRQRANQSYQDYLARQRRSGTSFQPGTGNTPVVNFPTINPPTTTPTPPTINPPTTTPAPPSSGGGGGGGGGGGSVYPGITPPNYIPPNTGGGGSGGGGYYKGPKKYFTPGGGSSGGGSSGGGKTKAGFDFSKKGGDEEIFADKTPGEYYKAYLENYFTNRNPLDSLYGAISPNQILTYEQQEKARELGTYDDMWDAYTNKFNPMLTKARGERDDLLGLSADAYGQRFYGSQKGATADDMAMYDQYGDIQNLNPKFYNEDGSLKMVENPNKTTLGEGPDFITAREAAGLEEGKRDEKDFLGAVEYLGYEDDELDKLRDPFKSFEDKEADYKKKIEEFASSEDFRNPDDAILDAIAKQKGLEGPDARENAQEEYRRRLAEDYGIKKPEEDTRQNLMGAADMSTTTLKEVYDNPYVQEAKKSLGFENITERSSPEQKKGFLKAVSDFGSKFRLPLTVAGLVFGGPQGAKLVNKVLGANEVVRKAPKVIDSLKTFAPGDEKPDYSGLIEGVTGKDLSDLTYGLPQPGASKVDNNNLIYGQPDVNTNIAYNKGGRVKLYNGGIPGFTEAEIAQRRRQQLMDSRERNRTSYSPVPSPIAPGGIPGGSPIPPQLNPQPIDQMPTLPPAMGEQGALPGFGTDNPGGEEYIATPGGGGSEYQTYITELPGAEPQPIDQMPMLPPDRPITESPFPGTGAYTPPGSENIMDGFQKYLDDSGAMNRPMTADVRSYKLPDGTVIQGNSTMKGITDKYLESIGQPPTTDVESQSGNNTYDLGGQKVEDTIDLDKIMNMDTFQYEKFMGGLSPEKRSEVQNQLDNMGPMGIAPPPGLMPGMPSGDPMLRQYGVSMTDYESMSPDQQDDLHAAVRYTQQYGAEPYTQSMILKERGINPDQFIKADGSYDRLALTQAKLASDIQEGIDDGYLSGVTLTGNESFQDLVDLDKKYMDAIMEEMANTPSYNPGTGGYYGGGGEPVYTPGEQVKRVIGYQPSDRSPGNSLMASGGRAGFKFGSMLETSNPDFGKQKKDKSHEYLLRLLKNKQTKQLNNSLKKMVSKSRQVKDKSPEQIAKAMKKLQQLKSFYGKR